MFTQAKLLYQLVRDDLLPLGSGNFPGASEDAKAKTTFVSTISDEIYNNFIQPAIKERIFTRKEGQMIRAMSSAMFAEAYQCGSCVAHANLVFVKSLELEFSECKERVQITGKKSLKGEFSGYTKKGTPRFTYYNAHNITVFARDEEKSLLSDESIFEGTVVVDTWGKGKVVEYQKENDPKGRYLVDGYFAPDKIEFCNRVEKNLTPEEWYKYASFLTDLWAHINENFPEWFKEGKRPQENYQQELESIYQVFNRKVKAYASILTSPFMIRHWKNNAPTLFQAEKGALNNQAPTEQVQKILSDENTPLPEIAPLDVVSSLVNR